jgi:hypothetical protein
MKFFAGLIFVILIGVVNSLAIAGSCPSIEGKFISKYTSAPDSGYDLVTIEKSTAPNGQPQFHYQFAWSNDLANPVQNNIYVVGTNQTTHSDTLGDVLTEVSCEDNALLTLETAIAVNVGMGDRFSLDKNNNLIIQNVVKLQGELHIPAMDDESKTRIYKRINN